MSGPELVNQESPDHAVASVGDEEARRFILRVKQTVERCLAQGMGKSQMFQVIREEGLEPGAAFAVYRELRHQNPGFFEEYFCMIDLKEQRQRFTRLLHRYRTRGGPSAEDGARVPETVTPPIAVEETDVPVNVEYLDQQTLQSWWSDGSGHQLTPTAWPPPHHQAVDLPAGEQVPDHGQPIANPVPGGVAWPHQQALNLPSWEQPHNHEQPLADGAFQGDMWPQQVLHLPAAQQLLHNHEGTAADDGFPGLVWRQQEVTLHNGQLLHHQQQQQQPAANDGLLQGLITWPQQTVHFPAAQLHNQEQAVPNGVPPLMPVAVAGHPWPVPHGDQSSWPGATANPSPSSSLFERPEDQNY